MKTPIMKTVSSLLAIVLIFVSLFATAQPDYRSEHQPGKSYWKIQTDYATRNTIIRFFNAQNEPIYQETLHGKYVKLSKRNIRLFDQMLDQVVNSQLLASQVKSYDLLASSDLRYTPSSSNRTMEETSPVYVPDGNHSFLVNPLVNESGKLRIHFVNPKQKRVLIELTDEQSRTVYYSEYSHQAGYNKYLNITHMLSGKYRLLMKSPEQKLAYWLNIDKSNHRYELIPAN